MPEVFADVSAWQGTINWPAYRVAGYTRAGIKATEGVGWIDPQFYNNELGSRGLQRIFYGYGRPDLGNSPEACADFLWQTVSPFLQSSDALELDYEQQGWGGNYEDWKRRWFARMATHTAFYGMYSGEWFTGPRGISWVGVGFRHVAIYGPEVTGYDIQQYSSSASFPGIQGNVDANWLLNPVALGGGGGGGGLPEVPWNDDDEKMLQAVHNTIQLGLLPLLSAIQQVPLIETQVKAISDALWAAGGHPADVAINAALKDITNTLNAIKATTDATGATVAKDLK